MPLEFICWSIFHFQIQFRPWLPPRGYVTWDGVDPVGIWGPQCTPPLASPVRGELLCELLEVGSWGGEGVDRGELAAVRMGSGGGFLPGAEFFLSSSPDLPPLPQL